MSKPNTRRNERIVALVFAGCPYYRLADVLGMDCQQVAELYKETVNAMKATGMIGSNTPTLRVNAAMWTQYRVEQQFMGLTQWRSNLPPSVEMEVHRTHTFEIT